MRIGAAIGSGGIRPVAAIPVLAALERLGLRPTAFAGCSGGGVIAALAAAGCSAAAARRIVERRLRRELFARLDPAGCARLLGCPVPDRRGLLRPEPILAMFREVFGARRIEELPFALALQATDLDAGEGVTLRAGPLAESLYASIAAHPMLPPIRLDGRWLGDGAFSQPLPLAALPERELRLGLLFPGPEPKVQRWLGLRFPAPEIAEGDGVALVRVECGHPVSWRDVHLLPQLFAAGERAAEALTARLSAERAAA